MRIAVDVDGVLADQVPQLSRWVTRKYGISIKKSDVKLWHQPIGDTDFLQEIEQALLDANFVLTMPLVRGARQALEKMASLHCVVVATSRPIEANESTMEWLKRNGLRFHEFLNTRKEGKSSLYADVLIDDHLESVRDFALTKGIAILLSQPWNSDHSSIEELVTSGVIVCAKNWQEIVEIVKGLREEKTGLNRPTIR